MTPAKQASREKGQRGFTRTANGSFELPLKHFVSVRFDTDASRRLLTAVAMHAKRSHLAIKIGALDPQRSRGVADAAVMLLENRDDVVAFESGARFFQR